MNDMMTMGQLVNSGSITTENATKSMNDTLNGMKNVGVSKSIAEKIQSKLSDFQNVLETLATNTSNYQTYYKNYRNTIFTDADILKERMKEKVLRVMNDDI